MVARMEKIWYNTERWSLRTSATLVWQSPQEIRIAIGDSHASLRTGSE